MIICIQPLEQWTGQTNNELAVYLELPEGIDPDKEIENVYYGENYQILMEHFVKLGAKVVENPIKTYYV